MENSYEAEQKEGYEISLADIFRIFRKGLWIMIVTAVVFAVAAFGYSKIFISKTYTAKLKLYVEVSNTASISSYNNLSDYNLATKLVNTYIEMLNGRDFHEQLSESTDKKYTAEQLQKMVSFAANNEVETDVFSVTVKASSPTEAKVIADCVAEVAPDFVNEIEGSANLKIVEHAVIPKYASSPNVTRNTIMAGAAGFALALIIVFLKELLDNKIKYDGDSTELNGIPILSAVPDFGGDRIILGVNSSLPEENKESEGE